MKNVRTRERGNLRTYALVLLLAACSSNSVNYTHAGDPRVGLRGGLRNAQSAAWNMKLVANVPTPEAFKNGWASDITFTRNYLIQGNFNGWQVWDISKPKRAVSVESFVCPGSQSDVSVYHNLLFVSGESLSGRLDCGSQGVLDPVSHDRLRGLRIFDITDIHHPKYIGNVQTCRGSHTHTVVEDPNDTQNVYVYISGSAGVRSSAELPGCSGLGPDQDPNSALFRIEVIKVPLSNPAAAAIVSSPRIFNDLAPAARHGQAPASSGPTQCHDITVYPGIGYAGGACGGYGLLLDIHDVANPKRLFAAADSNFSFWHSATFSNDGSKVLFTDEWGGGTQPRCRPTDKPEWGADAIFNMGPGGELVFQSYYKMPAAQTSNENCVAHNGNLIPVPGRDIMVQGWYQGGVSVFDWTDPHHPQEIAFFDRGPIDTTKLVVGGSWSAYWYNGHIYSSEIARGLDVFKLMPSQYLSQNELDAAHTYHVDYLNAQDQKKITWPATPALALALTDQLARASALPSAQIRAIRDAVKGKNKSRLSQLATTLGGSSDVKVKWLASTLRQL